MFYLLFSAGSACLVSETTAVAKLTCRVSFNGRSIQLALFHSRPRKRRAVIPLDPFLSHYVIVASWDACLFFLFIV